MCWATVGILVALQMGIILCGEISDFDYSPRHQGYHLNGPRSAETVLRTTAGDHQFTLALQKYTRWTSNRIVIQVFYDSYLLEKMKAPRFDGLNECVVTPSLVASVKPLDPTLHVEHPPFLHVRYSKVDGSCVQRSYKYKPPANKYKKYSHKVVGKENC